MNCRLRASPRILWLDTATKRYAHFVYLAHQSLIHPMRKILIYLLSLLGPLVGAQSPSSVSDFTHMADVFFGRYVEAGQVAYAMASKSEQLGDLVSFIGSFDYEMLEGDAQKAYLINAYNLLVIKGVLDDYPINSVLKVYGFFDQKEHRVAGCQMTLDHLEKTVILPRFQDPRLHFALACSALSCPPLDDGAFTPDQLDSQLDILTRASINDQMFIRVTDEQVRLSQIFDWYLDDFGGNRRGVLAFVNQYREEKLDPASKVSYYPYDWTLNDASPRQANNSTRYVVSSTIPKGKYELKVFNNLYSQRIPPPTSDPEVRESFYTALTTFLYGVTPRFNVGFNLRYRRVSAHNTPAGPLKIFRFEDALRSRSELATLGPMIRVAPNPRWQNFSIQSTLWFPITSDLSGNNGEPWLDWEGPSWWTQFFNDFTIGTNYSLFTEVDLFWEDIGGSERLNRFSTPVTGIFSYFPNGKTTLYGMLNFSPYWAPDLDYFFQPGLGAKYQFTRDVELELLYTYFTNSFLQDVNGRATTINLGLRISN